MLKVVAATALVLAGSAPFSEAVAQRGVYQFQIAQIREATPGCKDHPTAPWVGRVSGIFSGRPSFGVSFVGCFDNQAACERWRGPTTGFVRGRLIVSECQPRSGPVL